jgi:type II secretion system protein G
MFTLLKKKRALLGVKRGFTLIELLVVVAIIGILASVILVGVAAFRGRARDSRRISDVRSLQQVLELCFTKNGKYPTTEESLAGIVSSSVCNIGVSQMPNDPSSGNPYRYCSIDTNNGSNPNRYVIGTTLEEDNQVIRDQNGATFVCNPGGTACTTNGTGREYCATI